MWIHFSNLFTSMYLCIVCHSSKVCGPYVATHLNLDAYIWNLRFQGKTCSLVPSWNGHEKDTCNDEIGLCALKFICSKFSLSLIMNTIGRVYVIVQKEIESSFLVSHNSYIFNLIFKS